MRRARPRLGVPFAVAGRYPRSIVDAPSPPPPAPAVAPLAQGFGCLAGFVAFLVACVGISFGQDLGARLTVAVIGAIVILAGLGLAQRQASVIDRVAAPLSALPLALILAPAARLDLRRPLVLPSSFHHEGYPGGEAACIFLLALPFGALVLAALGRRAVRRVLDRDRPRVAAVVRALAWIAVAGAAGLIVAAVPCLGRPSPERYVASLPVLARLDAVDTSRSEAVRQRAQAGAFDLTRHVISRHRCALWIVEAGHEGSPWGLDVPFDACRSLVLRADAARGLWILEEEGGHTRAYEAARRGDPILVDARRLPGALRPPDAFTALAAIGVVVALAALMRTRRALPAEEGACRDGVARADGMVHFPDDTSPLPLPAGAAVAEGPVVAILATAAASFRDPAGPAVVGVLPGTLAEHRLAARLAPHAFVLAFVTIAATPLAVALLALR